MTEVHTIGMFQFQAELSKNWVEPHMLSDEKEDVISLLFSTSSRGLLVSWL